MTNELIAKLRILRAQGMSVRKACEAVGISVGSYQYNKTLIEEGDEDQEALTPPEQPSLRVVK